jgi:hypothetical protein
LKNFDLALVPLDALQLKALMQTDGSTPVIYNGRSMLLQDALAARMRGEGVPYEPAAEQATTASQPARGGIRIDPARLSAEQRSELEQTGNLAGFTATDRNRAMINVRDSSGSYTANIAHDDAGNLVVIRGLDIRDFFAPEGTEDDPRYEHLARQPAQPAQK